MNNLIAFRARPAVATPDVQNTPVNQEVQEQAAAALEQLLEKFTAHSNGQHFEISDLEADFSDPSSLGVRIHFRPVSAVLPLASKPA